MDRFKSLVGTGRLLVNGRDVGEVTFSVTLSGDGDDAKGTGVLSGNDQAIASAAAEGSAALALTDGRTLDIHVHAANSTRALFVVTGPVPAFIDETTLSSSGF